LPQRVIARSGGRKKNFVTRQRYCIAASQARSAKENAAIPFLARFTAILQCNIATRTPATPASTVPTSRNK
jgi:hypothetical protein